MSQAHRKKLFQDENTSSFLTIEGSLPGGKRLIYPLTLQVDRDDDEVLVSEPRFSIHAAAPTLADAVTEFKRILVADLEELTRDEAQLGTRLQAQLDYLRTLIGMAK